ncbi:MAG: cyclic nucleotide-binding domain-containing protein [Anaerolineae bacterium]|nr:cyclic nucleotide-binding domain-containing protein [Anaerolineae bacterium]
MNEELINRIKKLDLFKGAPDDILAKIADKTTMLDLEKNTVIVREGDPSDSLFIIRRGWIKIVSDGRQGEEVVLNQVGPGQIVGEMSLIDKQPRSSTMIALSPVKLMEIKYDGILDVIDQYPRLALSFLRDMTSRLRFANAYIEETVEWCQHIAAGNYEFVEKRVEQTQSTIIDMARSDEARASAFLSSFFKMVRGVKQREEALKQQVQELKIEIDEVKRQKAVTELTSSNFFEELQAAARKLRRKRDTDEIDPAEENPTTD